jgi:hypothetical protein
VPGPGGAPAEVDVGGEERELGLEAVEPLKHLAAYEHAGGVDREHLSHVVVLALVVLAPLQTGLPTTGGGDGHTELEEPSQRRPLPELGTEDVCVMGLGGGHQLPQRTRVGVRVVVEDPDPLGVDRRERLAYGVGEVAVAGGDGMGAEGVREQTEGVGAAAGVDGEDAVRRKLLVPETSEHRRQPPRTLVADQEGGDCHAETP